MTYSIVARDPGTGEFGVAVQSAVLGAGRIVPWAEAGVGAVATQAMAEIAFGPELLAALRAGATAADALAAAIGPDAAAAERQVALIGETGGPAAHTGSHTIPESGQVLGDTWSTQANMMARPGVPEAMAAAFTAAGGDLANRMLAALDAAELAGGDFRGRQAAGLVVVGAARTDRPGHGVLIDVRVEDHPEPVQELRRLVDMARHYGVLFEAEELLAVGDAAGVLAMTEPLIQPLAAIPDLAALRIAARVALLDEAGGRSELRTFSGDPEILRVYLMRTALAPDGSNADLLDRILDPNR